MNELFDLGMTIEDMQKKAVAIGADVPYCIQGGTALSEGIGEILTPLPSAPRCSVIIAKPPIHVSTRFVMKTCTWINWKSTLILTGYWTAYGKEISGEWQNALKNVLETVTEKEYPVIGQIKQFLMQREPWEP